MIARSENAILQQRCKELATRVKELSIENEGLKAEVEMYRKEAAVPNFSSLALGNGGSSANNELSSKEIPDEFVRSGNNVYPKDNDATLLNLHCASNILSCALSNDETILVTGGADAKITLCSWGNATAATTSPDEIAHIVNAATRIDCPGPVIALGFSPLVRKTFAGGCMDGSVCVGYLTSNSATGGSVPASMIRATEKHSKYVRSLVWAPDRPLLATGSADGTVLVHKIHVDVLNEEQPVRIEKVESLYLEGAIEALCFTNDYLICYARGTPYLSYFDRSFVHTKINLNEAGGTSSATGGFSDHVSFTVMDMKLDPKRQKYLALATDTSRNIIMDVKTGRQIRNLYGHSNDGFSQPKIAWSANGQYVLGNTQDEACICVWDVASSNLVGRLSHRHTSPVRDMKVGLYGTLVTTSFDKSTRLWFPPQEDEMDMER